MAQHEDSSVTALQELQQPSPSQDEQNQEQALLHRNDDRKRALVLIGSALSQLPIWGFAMSYGVLQEYYFDHWTLDGSRELTGIIGTTSNGVMYMSMPFLFALFTRRWVRFRQTAAAFGAILACTSFMLFALSTHVWHLIATQGVLAAPGCTLVFSPLTLSLGEWFKTPNRLCNRAVALGISLSNKNIVGSACPFFFRGLLDSYGFRVTMLAWGALMFGTASLHLTDCDAPPKLDDEWYPWPQDTLAVPAPQDLLDLHHGHPAPERGLRYPANLSDRVRAQRVQLVTDLLNPVYHAD
ncbi:hypothetical protein PMIN06_009415 [Paraphaeosphaeria minitans]